MNKTNLIWRGFENFSDISAKASIAPNGSVTRWPVIITSIRHELRNKVKTSKYQRILSEYYRKLNFTNNVTMQQSNETLDANTAQNSDKKLALILPLVLLGVFLILVIICHRYDSVKAKRSRKKQTGRSSSCSKNEAEQAVEEIAKEPDAIPVELRRMNWLANQKRNEMLHIYERACQNRCICKLVCCPHCTGYETKKLQWKGLFS